MIVNARVIRSAFYAWSRGIDYADATEAIDTVDRVRYLFGWDKPTCKEHVDYFVVMAKVKGLDISDTVKLALRIFVPRRVEEVFKRLEDNTF